MSKFVKNLVTRDISNRLEGVEDAVVVSTVGMDANTTVELRTELAEKDVQMMVVKNSLARRASEGTKLAPAFEGASGPIAVCWGSTDFVSLVKTIVALDKDSDKYELFKAQGGAMDGEALDAEGLKAVSKWPSREEQISLLVGQILAPGANLSAALLGPAKMLASQVKQIEEKAEDSAE
ncbi:50S ribosomal protein L10 [Roseimaritima ulvae]|uniref:Large ribosomal subunit protein uL10 n=1 Tax=Roseimaritima ulvae TaxID=980254 RepID=A0A5B9QPS5_9BACT|nr:50S ribosomal protein L10 [Roseimaritima ulvae]QEG39515.1 50S ribosomal protein L10 [Roseimaritima ulvae]